LACAKYYSAIEHLALDEINVPLFSNSMYQRNTNSSGQKSASYVIPRDISETYYCV
jgi:hypothetical protein